MHKPKQKEKEMTTFLDKSSVEFHHPDGLDKLHIGFDLDGTLKASDFPDMSDPYLWVKPLFKFLQSKGHRVWVYSARFNVDFYGGQASVWFGQAKEWMKQHGLSEYATLTKYKPPVNVLFDDIGQQLIGKNRTDVRACLNRIWALTKGTVHWPEEIIRFADFSVDLYGEDNDY